MEISLIIEGKKITGEQLVAYNEMQENKHLNPRVWKPKIWYEIQDLMKQIRKQG